MGFDLRSAVHADVPSVVAMYEWLFAPPGYRPEAWALAEAIDSDEALVLLAVAGGQPVGLCTVYLDLHSVRFGPRAWAEDLVVDPASRSAGIGKALLSGAREWARDHGASHLELDSGEAREDAHRFYDREGAAYRSFSFGWNL